MTDSSRKTVFPFSAKSSRRFKLGEGVRNRLEEMRESMQNGESWREIPLRILARPTESRGFSFSAKASRKIS